MKGEPEFILRREVAQYAGSVKEAGQILKAAQRSGTKMWLVADSKTAGIYEFNSEKFAYYEMVEDYLILTNHTRISILVEHMKIVLIVTTKPKPFGSSIRAK